MEIKNLGVFILTQDKSYRTSNSVFTLSKGTLISVTQIDYKHNKFYSEILGDWNHWEQPVELLNKEEHMKLLNTYKLH